MSTKTFKGKAIYNPSGKAGEYSYWACNFYTGCSNDCTYCYCKRGVLASTWSNTPKLKKCFKNERHALEIFEKELKANLPELQKHGLLFSFTTDPMLSDTQHLTKNAVKRCLWNDVPVKILTKRAINSGWMYSMFCDYKHLIAFGFTITGRDDLEPNASTNAERIKAMRKLHEAGFKTWASIEPVIDIESSLEIIRKTRTFCDLYKIGLQSGKKYDSNEAYRFIRIAEIEIRKHTKIYFKDSLLAQAGINRADLPANCVDRDYNMFND